LKEIYADSPLATAFVSRSGKVLWRNDAARTFYPVLALPQGLSQMLAPEQREALQACLAGSDAFSMPLGLGDAALLFLPAPDFWIMQAVLREAQSGDPLRPEGTQRVIGAFNASQRRPISEILSGASAVARAADLADDELLRQTARRINDSAYRLLRFTQMLTLYLRLQYGLLPPQSICFDFARTVGAIGATAVFAALRAEIPLDVKAPAEPVLVVADEEQLTFAILQLISNACRFTRPGNRIALLLDKGADSAVLTVSDEGAGIEPDALPHVSEPFFSCDADGAPDTGAGLGLSIATWLVQAAGGTLAITSTRGQGTTAVLRLPLAPPDAEAALHASQQALEAELRERFSLLQVLLSDGCGAPLP